MALASIIWSSLYNLQNQILAQTIGQDSQISYMCLYFSFFTHNYFS